MINPTNLSCWIFRKSAFTLPRDVFEFPSKRSNHHFPLSLALRSGGTARIRGELSQNQNNSIDGVARITRGTTISARWGAKTSRGVREKVLSQGLESLSFLFNKIFAACVLFVFYYANVTLLI